MSRIIAGKIRLVLQPVDFPSRAFGRALDGIIPAAEASFLRVESAIDHAARRWGRRRPRRLQQVLWTLSPTRSNSPTPEAGRTTC